MAVDGVVLQNTYGSLGGIQCRHQGLAQKCITTVECVRELEAYVAHFHDVEDCVKVFITRTATKATQESMKKLHVYDND